MAGTAARNAAFVTKPQLFPNFLNFREFDQRPNSLALLPSSFPLFLPLFSPFNTFNVDLVKPVI